MVLEEAEMLTSTFEKSVARMRKALAAVERKDPEPKTFELDQ